MAKPFTRIESKGGLLRENLKAELAQLRERHEESPIAPEEVVELFDILDRSMEETERYVASLAREALHHGVTKFQLQAGVTLCHKAIYENSIDARSVYRREFARELLEIMQVQKNEQQH